MGRGKRRECLSYNAFKIALDFRGGMELGGLPIDVYKMADFPFRATLQKVNQSGELGCY